MESEPMLTQREKSSLPEKNSHQRRIEPTTLHQAGQRAQHTTNELFRGARQSRVNNVCFRGARQSRVNNVCLLVGCLTSQQHASVSQGRICSDNVTCCHTEIEVADPTFYLTQSQYTDTGPTSPSADPITPGAWQGSHWNVNF